MAAPLPGRMRGHSGARCLAFVWSRRRASGACDIICATAKMPSKSFLFPFLEPPFWISSFQMVVSLGLAHA